MNEDKKEHAKLSVQEAVRQSIPADDMNGRRMAAEIFGELPAEHPDSPYADEIKAMRRAGIVVSRFLSWNPQGNLPVCSVDGLPGMMEQSGKRSEPVTLPFP